MVKTKKKLVVLSKSRQAKQNQSETILNSSDRVSLMLEQICYKYEASLEAKDKEIKKLKAEINLLNTCVHEAIKRPMGIEPAIYSDYKMRACQAITCDSCRFQTDAFDAMGIPLKCILDLRCARGHKDKFEPKKP